MIPFIYDMTYYPPDPTDSDASSSSGSFSPCSWSWRRLRPDAPLISLLYQERFLRRPIVFVPSTLKPVLFDQVEDLSKPVVEEVGAFSYSFLISKIGNTE